ncbi:hypothetical protein K490DRAFT_55084 [Saccharata proteae CBS 121410]|uniref:Uncharacterized protein n=1 Tax=Saccharata proteae CBS 121410 TaxID=1314787 RepID=A0A6A5YF91_9PEZI|nr:hypothetical protein K490DRAFT_55084 [Saccharata proteae CBS 121410]
MTGITSSIGNLISSVLALFRDIINGAFSALQSMLAVFVSFFQGLLGLVKDAAGFLLHNFIILGVLGALAVVFFVLQQKGAGGVILEVFDLHGDTPTLISYELELVADITTPAEMFHYQELALLTLDSSRGCESTLDATLFNFVDSQAAT